MGQILSETIIPETFGTVKYEVQKHTQILSEIRTLTYEEFEKSLKSLNELSKKCLDPNGKQLVFAVRKGSDASLLWKATVQVACVKVDPVNNDIEAYQLLNLKDFIQVFKTFQSHLQILCSSESQGTLTTSVLLNEVNNITKGNKIGHSSTDHQASTSSELLSECSICLDRQPDVILPCAHSFCCPCIEQWNMSKKTCPICQECLESTDDGWVISEKPEAQEINEKICTELMALSKSK